MKNINKILMKAKLKNYKKNIERERARASSCSETTKPLNAWQMPPFIGQILELLI